MADVAFGVLGVVSLAIQIGQMLDKLCTAYKDLPDDLRLFQSELAQQKTNLENAQALLRSPQQLQQEQQQGRHGTQPTSTIDTIAAKEADNEWVEQCRVELTRLLDEVSIPKRSLPRRWDRIKKSLRADALRQSMDRLNRFCDQVNQSVNVQTLDAARQMQAQLQVITDVNVQNRNRVVVNWLSPILYTRRHQDLLDKWHEGTVDWIFEQDEFIDWCSSGGGGQEFKTNPDDPDDNGDTTSSESSSRPVLWYHGGRTCMPVPLSCNAFSLLAGHVTYLTPYFLPLYSWSR